MHISIYCGNRDGAITPNSSAVLTTFYTPPRCSSRNKVCARSSIVAVPASLAPPSLPPQPIWCDVLIELLLGAKRCENVWLPRLVSAADGVLIPASVTRYDGQQAVGRCHAADTGQTTVNQACSADCLLKALRSTSMYLSLFSVCLWCTQCSSHSFMIPVFIWTTFVRFKNVLMCKLG